MSWKKLIKESSIEDLEYLFEQVYDVLGDLHFNVIKRRNYSDIVKTFKEVLEDLFKEL